MVENFAAHEQTVTKTATVRNANGPLIVKRLYKKYN